MRDFLKKYFEYINLAVVFVMYMLACFHYVFTVIAMGYLMIVCMFMKSEQIIKIQILTRLFYDSILFFSESSLSWVLDWFIILYLKNWLVDLFVNKQKMNYKLLVLIVLICTYNAVAPIFKPTALEIVVDSCKLFTIYFIYEKRDKLNFVSLSKVFCYGLMFSGFFGLICQYALNDFFLDMCIPRFNSLFYHPNVLSDFSLMAIVILFALKYYNKIFMPEFCLLIIFNFAFGYATISRNFILLFVIIFVIFSIIYLLKYGKYELSFILKILALILAICLLLEDQTYYYFNRVDNYYEKDGLKSAIEVDGNGDYWQCVLMGGYYDPGRLGLWMIYFSRIFETFKSFMFGYGIGAPAIGTMKSHNILFWKLYQNGFVGLILSIVAIVLMIDFKELKKIKKYLGIYLIVVAYIGDMLINDNSFMTAMAVILIAGFMFVKKDKADKKEEMFYSGQKMIGKFMR